jgi:hypothetical protein
MLFTRKNKLGVPTQKQGRFILLILLTVNTIYIDCKVCIISVLSN